MKLDTPRRVTLLILGVLVVLAGVWLVRRSLERQELVVAPPGAELEVGAQEAQPESRTGALPGGAAAPPPDPDVLPPPPSGPLPEDLEVFRQKLALAEQRGLAALRLGELIAQLGRTFVGTPYRPGTLDPPGPERLVINLRELDCVTFIENVFALSLLIQEGRSEFDAFQAELTRLRYRSGVLDGYPSRLHYFSEWISDNERKGLVRDITRELGGIADPEPINFMSRNASAYPQLADPEHVAAIREIEARLSAQPRFYIPQDRIAAAAPGIRNGDIIAATSTVNGLDIAHTGIAIWIDDRLHLMHAPLVGRSVEISELPLADRIRGISGQDGIMVARPVDR